MMREMVADILVLGGGPAGVVVAAQLAKLGYHVILATERMRPPAVEGLSERGVEGLRAAGFERSLQAVGARACRIAYWNGTDAAANQEHIVDRRLFDVALRRDAVALGVEVVYGRVGRSETDGQQYRVQLHRRGQSQLLLAADYLVEARGRRAPLSGGVRVHGPATVSLARVWKSTRPRPQTVVASFADGWIWYGAGNDSRSVLQIIVASQNRRLTGRSALTSLYDQLLKDADDVGHLIANARPVGPIIVRNAGPMFTEPLVGERYLRVGDAGVAMDPLSGHGLYEAFGSALAAAPVINTILRQSERAHLAQEFFYERAMDVFYRSARTGRAFYAMERQWPDRPFWAERREWPDRHPAHAPAGKGEASIRIRAVIRNHLVDEQEVIVTPDHPRGVWQVAGVALVPLLRYLQSQRHRESDLDHLATRFATEGDAVRVACAWLRYRGLLH